jgi:cellulose synthase/poly-beta-1,6-N-acetylglucosamine synthase-like glycosyltransferase
VSEQPLVTAVVPTHNRPELLARALASVSAQTWRNLQVIVVNDAGRDVSDVVTPHLTRAADRYIRHETNRGLAAARNTALQAATGEFIAYLDDDDLWLPHHVETLAGALLAQNRAMGYSSAWRVTYRREQGGYVEQSRLLVNEPWDRTRMILSNYIHPLCFMHRRECMEKSGLFDESLSRLEDMELWIRMSAHYEVVHVPVATCEYRVVDDGSNMTSGDPAPFRDCRERIYRKHLALLPDAIDDLLARERAARIEVRGAADEIRRIQSHPLFRLVQRLRGRR